MVIYRVIEEAVRKAIGGERKVIIIYGPRQAGKTTLIKSLAAEMKSDIPYFTGDDLYTQEIFGKHELEALKRVVGSSKIIIIDEAQRIEQIGLTMKLLFDNLSITIIASGSASFELANKISEPLTGRTKTFWLYPLSLYEVKNKYQKTATETAMSEMLRYGMYPKIHTLTSEKEKQDYLYEYLNNYLYKDILVFGDIRKPKKVIDLLTLIALQIGKEASIAELSKNLAMSQKTVESYLDILEKMFVLVNLRGFSRNLRKEIYKTSKYFFVDVGLRNALIRNFNPLHLRSDSGELYENWFIVEKMKTAANFGHPANFYFWRTYDQQEIDLIEEKDGKLTGYECKFSSGKKGAPPKDWTAAYANAEYKLVDPVEAMKILSSENY